MIDHTSNTAQQQNQTDITPESNQSETNKENNSDVVIEEKGPSEVLVDITDKEPWLSANPSEEGSAPVAVEEPDQSVEADSTTAALQLIQDCEKVDYEAYIPEMKVDSKIKEALDITNPQIEVDASAAILFDAKTGDVMYYKNAVDPVFPASTAKLLTALVALEWCEEEEEITVGEEIKMIAPDSSRAYLKEGQILTVRSMLEGMLVPSGNDAAYAMATYVGRKSLQKENASKEEAVIEFIRLMNQKASDLGVKNSCFKTPDGYDAIGQYTTAYDMGMIGLAAVKLETIVAICKKSSARNIFISGEDVTWDSTDAIITKWSGHYYSCAIGLKTGTSTMAGRCIISAGRKDGKEVVCAVMDSSSVGRWNDAVKLLEYGLQ